ncbi:peroxisomal membrane protein PEX14 [Biomphalaria glabrata]|nr:peroxisomal membrane protein PEX14-like [Biomphalaria glabrata]
MDQDSDNNPLNGDSDKQILAPAEGPRENLINTAVKFLQNPKVMSSPLYQKKAFLEKKGLTPDEINIAVQKSGVVETENMVASTGVGPPGYQSVNTEPPKMIVSIPPQSAWAKARDLTLTTVVVASISYAVYQLFHKYLRPWLLGKSIQEKRLERLESRILENHKCVAESLAEVNKTLLTIQASLNTQQKQSQVTYGEQKGISELKSDIASLKGLLLNRNQFPPAPSTSPILPSWQRVQSQVPPIQSQTESGSTNLKSYSEAVKLSSSTCDTGESRPSASNISQEAHYNGEEDQTVSLHADEDAVETVQENS